MPEDPDTNGNQPVEYASWTCPKCGTKVEDTKQNLDAAIALHKYACDD